MLWPKGPTRRARKQATAVAEAARMAAVRRQVMQRERYHCRVGRWGVTQALFGECSGPLEWAHWGRYRRFLTRGWDPDARHCPAGSVCLCDRHHDDYDATRLAITALTPRECDGRLRFSRQGVEWEEPE